ncbi:MAG: LysR family transcriptional regulator [Janthinobacterium lividum]
MSLSVFVAAVEEGSIAAAGRRFGLSAVMAGRYLSALEESLSARLVQRTTRRLSLTDAGRAYFVKSKRILEDLEEAGAEAADLQATPRGVLRIAAPITFGAMYLGPVAARYMVEYPGVDVVLQLQDRFVDLLEEGVDLAIRIGKLPDSELVARKLGECRLMACAAPSYLAAAGIPETPADLTAHRLIGYIGDATAAPWRFVGSDGQATELEYRCRFVANNTGVMLEVALAGFGIVYGPSFVFAKHLARAELVPVLPAYACPILPLHAILPTAKHVSAKTRLFIESLKIAFGDPAPWA